jgi:hypothetical protein
MQERHTGPGGGGIFAQTGKASREVEKNRCISLKTNSILSLFFVLGVNLYNESCIVSTSIFLALYLGFL